MKNIADANNEKETVTNLIIGASTRQLKVVLRLLHFVCNGDIPLRGNIYQLLSKARKIGSLRRKVEKKKALSNSLKEDPGSQKTFLLDYVKYLSSLIEPLFTKK